MAKPEVRAAKAAPKAPAEGILPSQAIRELIVAEDVRLAEPLLPNQLQPASLDLRLGNVAYRVRASFLPGRGERSPPSSTICSCTPSPVAGCRAGNGLRLRGAAARKPGVAGRAVRGDQPQELDRPARRVHARHRRRRLRLRPDPGRLRGPALRRDLPADLPRRRAQGLAAVADPLPQSGGARAPKRRATTSRCRSILLATRTASSAIAPSAIRVSSMSTRSAPAPCSTTGSRSTCAARSG